MQPQQPQIKIIKNIMGKINTEGGLAMKKSINKVSERRAAYLFVIPAVALLAAFLIYPSLQTIRYAFTDYNIMRPDRIVFCGFNNFAELFQDEDSFTSNAFNKPLSGLELYMTVQRIATTTIEVTCGLKYAARNTDTPFLLEEIKRARANARIV